MNNIPTLTARMAANGELTVTKSVSEKARKGYRLASGTIKAIYEYDRDTYYIRYDDGKLFPEPFSLDELNSELEAYWQPIGEHIADAEWCYTGLDLDELKEDLLSCGYETDDIDPWIAENGESFLKYFNEEE